MTTNVDREGRTHLEETRAEVASNYICMALRTFFWILRLRCVLPKVVHQPSLSASAFDGAHNSVELLSRISLCSAFDGASTSGCPAVHGAKAKCILFSSGDGSGSLKGEAALLSTGQILDHVRAGCPAFDRVRSNFSASAQTTFRLSIFRVFSYHLITVRFSKSAKNFYFVVDSSNRVLTLYTVTSSTGRSGDNYI